MLLVGCSASKPKPPTEGPPLPHPYDLRVEASAHELELIWQVDRQPEHIFSGYNIYIVEHPVIGTDKEASELEKVKPYNQLPYPGDTDADVTHESYVAQGLDEGQRYYCFVRALGVGGQLGAPSNEVMAICRPGGHAAIQKIFSGDTDGFDFSRGDYVNSDASDCDLAYYIKDGTDQVIAPAKIDPLLRDTRFWDLGKTAGFESSEQPELTGDGVSQVTAHPEHLYVFRTADDHYGKFWIESIRGEGDGRTIRFIYMYQSIPNLIYLK